MSMLLDPDQHKQLFFKGESVQPGDAVLFMSSWLKKQCPTEKLDLLYVLILATCMWGEKDLGVYIYSQTWLKNVLISSTNEVPLLAGVEDVVLKPWMQTILFFIILIVLWSAWPQNTWISEEVNFLLIFLIYFHHQHNVFHKWVDAL